MCNDLVYATSNHTQHARGRLHNRAHWGSTETCTVARPRTRMVLKRMCLFAPSSHRARGHVLQHPGNRQVSARHHQGHSVARPARQGQPGCMGLLDILSFPPGARPATPLPCIAPMRCACSRPPLADARTPVPCIAPLKCARKWLGDARGAGGGGRRVMQQGERGAWCAGAHGSALTWQTPPQSTGRRWWRPWVLGAEWPAVSGGGTGQRRRRA